VNLKELIALLSLKIEAVVELLEFLGRPSNPLPEIVMLADGAKLTRSSKGDCYYLTSTKGCSCPGYTYRHNCKHMKSLLNSSSRPRGQTIAETLEELDRNIYKMPASYRRMVRIAREDAEAEPLELIPRGRFRPVLE
jgi:hypothetical protein